MAATAIATRILHNAADAEDIVQDALIRVWKHRERFRDEPRFGPWLFRIVTNRALDVVRHRRIAEAHAAELTERVQHATAEAELLSAEIRGALEKLPPMQRLVAQLFLGHGFTHAEIAGMTTLAEGTVRSHLSHARRKLRLAFDGW
ncbi:MAG: sigma-70 family RNA polymerase sigma factor [Acidobacteria bacterium]|nr:sigma-70 family RNA polymerase sigma factor [Acidobacteriota bacterium]